MGTVYYEPSGGITGAPDDASYVTVSAEAGLSDERVFTDGDAIVSVDGGANSIITVGVDISTLAADTAIGDTDVLTLHDGAMKKVTWANLKAQLTTDGFGSGDGDVVGPGATVVDRSVPAFNGTGGLTILETGVLIDSSNNVSGAANISGSGVVTMTGTGQNQFSGEIEIPMATKAMMSLNRTTAAITNSMPLAEWRGGGVDTTDSLTVLDAFRLVIVANQVWSAGNAGTRAEFYTTPNGTVAEVICMTLEANGDVKIENGGLQVAGAADSYFVGDVTIGSSTAPDGTLHVLTGSAGTVTASTLADEGVFENNNTGGISILTPDNNAGTVAIGSPSDNIGASMTWTFDTSTFSVGSRKTGGVCNLVSGNSVISISIASNQKATFLASSTARAGVNHPHGAAPTSPVNGDMWTTTAGLFAEINGSTVGPFTA